LPGYFSEFSNRFSLNVGVGAGVDDGPDWAARTVFVWQFK
jgi:hypothetical protein